jgi:glycosyltransferase involved in cell wall biosynthesis
VGTVATIRRVKGTDLLLEAAIECADLDDIYWLLIGPVRDRKVSSLASDRRIRERVRLLGYRADAPSLISGADLFVMPSRREALCRALLEAMAQRVCPVVSDVGGMKEVVRDGVDGLVIPSENVGALARAIRELHADRELVRRFSDSAMNRVVRDFSPECVAERTIELYHRVLNC